MATPTFFIPIRRGLPGAIVDLYVTATGERIATGVLGAVGNLDLEYPQSYGPAHYVIRDPAVPQPWQANTAYLPGDMVASPHFGGWALRCAISGTSGSTEPTDANRMKGMVHRPVFVGKAFAGMGALGGGGSVGSYGYTSLNANTAHDGGPHTWFDGTAVDAVVTNQGAYMLRSDGTVRFSHSSVNGDTNAAHAKCQALTNIVKLYGYKYGICARDTSDNLHHVWDYDSSSSIPLDTLLANNPTAVAMFPGAERGSEATLLLADGTAISNDSNVNNRLSEIGNVDIVHGVQNALGYFLCLCEDGKRLRGREDHGVIDYSGTWIANDYDAVDELQASHSILAATYRSGRRHRWLTAGSVYDDQENMIAYMVAPPTEIYPATTAWSAAPDYDGTYVFTPYSGTAIEKPNGFSNGLRGGIDPIYGRRIDLGGHPIIRDGGCTWHLVKPQGGLWAGGEKPESRDGSTAAPVPVGTISGTLSVNQVAAERPLLALSYKDGQPEILAHGTSDANGDFALAMAGQTDPVYILALDSAGPSWQAGQAASGGERVIPTASGHTGLVYECINDGVAGVPEPVWPTEIGGVIVDGTITWEAISYYQPQAHGPVHPIVSGTPDDIEEGGNTYAYSDQVTVEGVLIQIYANDQDGTDLIYRRLVAPGNIVDGDTWAYTRTHDAGGHFYADEYANTVDADDLIYRLLDGSVITGALPLNLTLPGGDFETLDNWTDTTGTSVLKSSQVGPYDGATYLTGGNSPLVETYQELDFADDIGLPAWAWHGHTLAVRWQQSSYSTSDQAMVRATFLDDQGVDISTFSASLIATTEQIWTARSISAPVPASAVGLRIEIEINRTAGTNNDGYLDAMNLLLSV